MTDMYVSPELQRAVAEATRCLRENVSIGEREAAAAKLEYELSQENAPVDESELWDEADAA